MFPHFCCGPKLLSFSWHSFKRSRFVSSAPPRLRVIDKMRLAQLLRRECFSRGGAGARRTLISELMLKLDDSKMFCRDHETFEEGYVIRFETSDGLQSAARLIVWTKSSKGVRYVVIPQTSPETNVQADLYESYKFVSSLERILEGALAAGKLVIE